MAESAHIPVLVSEVMALFSPQPGDRLLDATLGHGGHAKAYLSATEPTGSVVGLDADAAALAVAQEQLREWGSQVTYIQTNFTNLIDSVHGSFQHILFDLGIGSHQLADDTRGFSFVGLKSLSMRYGNTGHLPPASIAALNRLERQIGHTPDVSDILRGVSEEELADIIWTYGEERFRGRIARELKQGPPPASSAALAQRISHAVPSFYRRSRIHPATRTFQALRLAVNRELESLEAALPQAWELLTPGGKLAVISFHSLEDRIVKTTFRHMAAEKKAKILTKKPIRGSTTEIATNPRARSAKLRVLQRDG